MGSRVDDIFPVVGDFLLVKFGHRTANLDLDAGDIAKAPLQGRGEFRKEAEGKCLAKNQVKLPYPGTLMNDDRLNRRTLEGRRILFWKVNLLK